MSTPWITTAPIIALNAVAILGVLLIILGLLGRAELSHPRCRKCKADLRPLAWTLANDAARTERERVTCPNCGRVLAGRAVRWRPFPVVWRAVGVGAILTAVAIWFAGWTAERIRRGLTWRDLVPVAWDLRAIGRDGYPDRASRSIRADWQTATWQSGAWQSLDRRATAGVLSIDALDAAARVIERSTSDTSALKTFIRARNWPAPHADLLIEILRSDVDPALRRSVAAILISPPVLTVAAVRDDATVHCGDRVTLTLKSAGAGQLWGDHSQLLDARTQSYQLSMHRLECLFYVQDVRLDGASIAFDADDPRWRSGTVGWHPPGDRRKPEQMPTLTCAIKADPGIHEITVVVDRAVVDYPLAEAIIASDGEPGPPERWGARTIVRREIVRHTLFVEDANAVAEGDNPRRP